MTASGVYFVINDQNAYLFVVTYDANNGSSIWKDESGIIMAPNSNPTVRLSPDGKLPFVSYFTLMQEPPVMNVIRSFTRVYNSMTGELLSQSTGLNDGSSNAGNSKFFYTRENPVSAGVMTFGARGILHAYALPYLPPGKKK